MNYHYIYRCFFLLLLTAFFAQTASAVPAFARKYDKGCSNCHTAYPQLNKVGRDFKEAGYRFKSNRQNGKKISDFLYLDENFPISGILIGRPYDKKQSGNEQLRAVHEVEIIVSGILGEQWSGYFEIEAEDETGFEPEFSPAVLSFHWHKALNFQVVYGPTFWADPYGFLGDHFRLTRGHVGIIDQEFGGADAGGQIRAARQNFGIYGRPVDNLFYNVNISGVADDVEGENAQNYSARLAYDITNGIMLGTFGVSGEDELTGRDFSRYGVDFQFDIGDARIQGAYVQASDDDLLGVSEDNNAFSLQAMWVFTNDSLRPTWVPLIRFDSYEQNDGVNEFDEVTFNLGYYFDENIKVYFEYWDRVDAPTTLQEDDRITVQLVIAF